MWWAEKKLRAGEQKSFRRWTILSAVMGAIFLFGEAREYSDLIGKGVNLGTNLFGTTLFTLTGFHAFHVLIGMCLLLSVAGVGSKHDLIRRKRRGAVEAVALYWHFVDAMWIFIFSVVYLWSAGGL